MAKLVTGEIEGTPGADEREVASVFGEAVARAKAVQQEVLNARQEVLQHVADMQRRVIS